MAGQSPIARSDWKPKLTIYCDGSNFVPASGDEWLLNHELGHVADNSTNGAFGAINQVFVGAMLQVVIVFTSVTAQDIYGLPADWLKWKWSYFNMEQKAELHALRLEGNINACSMVPVQLRIAK